jgi:hypothetical protein
MLIIAIFIGGIALVLYTFHRSRKFQATYGVDGTGTWRDALVAIMPEEQPYACLEADRK